MKRYPVRLRPQAEADLASLHQSLSDTVSAAFADEYFRRVTAYLNGFEFAPHRGTQRYPRARGLRTVGWKGQLTIGFRVHERPREVIIYFIAGRGRHIASGGKRD